MDASLISPQMHVKSVGSRQAAMYWHVDGSSESVQVQASLAGSVQGGLTDGQLARSDGVHEESNAQVDRSDKLPHTQAASWYCRHESTTVADDEVCQHLWDLIRPSHFD